MDRSRQVVCLSYYALHCFNAVEKQVWLMGIIVELDGTTTMWHVKPGSHGSMLPDERRQRAT
jgi:hypothetical protein